MTLSEPSDYSRGERKGGAAKRRGGAERIDEWPPRINKEVR